MDTTELALIISAMALGIAIAKLILQQHGVIFVKGGSYE